MFGRGAHIAPNQLIRPFLADSIARDVLDKLNDGQGALSGKFSQSFFDAGGLRTTSVVSYGLRPLVRPSAPGPLFARWTDADKDTFVSFENDAARKRYIDYCASQIGLFLAAAKSRLPAERWTTSRTVQNRLLTPTVVNGLIGAMRQALNAGVEMTFENLRNRLADLETFPVRWGPFEIRTLRFRYFLSFSIGYDPIRSGAIASKLWQGITY